jgi:IS30 family transposase
MSTTLNAQGPRPAPKPAGRGPERFQISRGAQRRPMGYTHLTLADRIEQEDAVRRGDSQNAIAERLCRSPGTISRELTPNGGREHYRALAAQQSANAQAGAARRDFLRDHGPQPAAQRPARDPAPRLVARRDWPKPASHAPDRADHAHLARINLPLRLRGRARRAQTRTGRLAAPPPHQARSPPPWHPRHPGQTPGQGLDRPPPARGPEPCQRGNFQDDLITSPTNTSAVVVLVERITRFMLPCQLPEKDATSVRAAFVRKLAGLPLTIAPLADLRPRQRNGRTRPNRGHLQTRPTSGTPTAPRERATCESQNNRLRHDLSRGLDLATVSDQKLCSIQDMLNERPRKNLQDAQPAKSFHQLLISNPNSN